MIRKAVASANTNALRMALYMATRDPDLLNLRMNRVPVRGGAQFMRVVAKVDMPVLEEKAIEYLMGPHKEAPPTPSESEARQLIALFSGEPLSDNYARFGLEELAFDEFPRDWKWTNKPAPEALDKISVLVVGGGISGLTAAIQLKRLGLKFKVIERQEGIGGTWHLNDYPEARVDTSSYMYQYKFEKNYPWTEFFASRNETKAYLNHIASKYGVADDFVFNTEVKEAIWDEGRAVWDVVMRDKEGEETRTSVNFIITGSGLFSTPRMPNIPGIETFEGKMFHTTQWDHDYDFKGKRVALIGTGSTGVQLMPALARGAAHLTVYQRSANWIAGAPGYRDRVPPETQLLFDNVPFYWNWFCYSSFDTSVQLQNCQTYDEEWRKTNQGVSEANEKVRANLVEYMRDKLEGREDLIEKCMPNHPPLARRLVVDNGFYESLLRPNVELITDGIERISPKGIVGKDGVEREYDLIVLGAGFHVTRYLFPVNYVGRDGMTLEKAWEKDGARAYLGMLMPDFPNLFMMYGPNGQPRSGGFYSWAEIWARYIAGVIVNLVENGKHSATIKHGVFDDYNRRLDEEDAKILWREESKDSYYNNEFGRQAINISFRTEDLHAMFVEPRMSEFDVR